MFKSLYGKYFQKSKSFLYPALGIPKKKTHNPSGTYISVEGCIEPEDCKLACVFNKNVKDFEEFEKAHLTSNPLFLEKIEMSEEENLYIFDFEIYIDDWFNFLLGKYSKLSSILKRAIKQYYGKSSSEYVFIDSYLYPEEYYEDYASLLDIDVDSLKETGELCDPYNPEKEHLIPKKYLDCIKKSS